MTWDWETNPLSAAVEKNLGVLVGENLHMSCAVSKESWPTGRGSGFSLSAAVRARPEHSIPLRCPQHENGVFPGEHEDAQRAGAALHLRLRELGLMSLEMARGKPHYTFPFLKGAFIRDRVTLYAGKEC